MFCLLPQTLNVKLLLFFTKKKSNKTLHVENVFFILRCKMTTYQKNSLTAKKNKKLISSDYPTFFALKENVNVIFLTAVSCG